MKLTVIIPVYNVENTIRRVVKSVDTTRDVEVICINDGSTDRTKRVLTELQEEVKHLIAYHQDNQGAAESRNMDLSAMSDDIDAFMFLDTDDQFLPGKMDQMIQYYEKNDHLDIVVGQIGRGMHGDWKVIPTHEDIHHEAMVSLAEAPEILQSTGPGDKLFKAKLNALRFDENVVLYEEHTFVTRAYLMSRDIQLIPFIVYGYNEREGSITDQRADTFISYLEDARKVRREVMDMLLLVKEKAYYSYRMDDLIISYLIRAHLIKYSKVTLQIVDKTTQYIRDMQHTNYSGEALFRIVQVIEQSATHWTRETYELWRHTLIEVGIGRPGFLHSRTQIIPKKLVFSGKQSLKRMMNKQMMKSYVNIKLMVC